MEFPHLSSIANLCSVLSFIANLMRQQSLCLVSSPSSYYQDQVFQPPCRIPVHLYLRLQGALALPQEAHQLQLVHSESVTLVLHCVLFDYSNATFDPAQSNPMLWYEFRCRYSQRVVAVFQQRRLQRRHLLELFRTIKKQSETVIGSVQDPTGLTSRDI